MQPKTFFSIKRFSCALSVSLATTLIGLEERKKSALAGARGDFLGVLMSIASIRLMGVLVWSCSGRGEAGPVCSCVFAEGLFGGFGELARLNWLAVARSRITAYLKQFHSITLVEPKLDFISDLI